MKTQWNAGTMYQDIYGYRDLKYVWYSDFIIKPSTKYILIFSTRWRMLWIVVSHWTAHTDKMVGIIPQKIKNVSISEDMAS